MENIVYISSGIPVTNTNALEYVYRKETGFFHTYIHGIKKEHKSLFSLKEDGSYEFGSYAYNLLYNELPIRLREIAEHIQLQQIFELYNKIILDEPSFNLPFIKEIIQSKNCTNIELLLQELEAIREKQNNQKNIDIEKQIQFLLFKINLSVEEQNENEKNWKEFLKSLPPDEKIHPNRQ